MMQMQMVQPAAPAQVMPRPMHAVGMAMGQAGLYGMARSDVAYGTWDAGWGKSHVRRGV